MPDGNPWPRISVVTPSFNQGRFIEETIRSVLLQGYPNLEYIIIDGGSRDNSVEIIRKYEPWLTYWVSEKDHGQSHAINKGFAHCTGDISNWINSDDLLTSGALPAVALAWTKNPPCLIAGPVINFSDEGTETTIAQQGLTVENLLSVQTGAKHQISWHQPGIFMPRAHVLQAGGLREDLELTMDRVLLIHILSAHPAVSYIPHVLARFRLHDVAKTATCRLKFGLEWTQAARYLEGVSTTITRAELDEQYILALLTNAAHEGIMGRIAVSFRHLAQALAVSIPVTVSQLWRGVLRRLVRLRRNRPEGHGGAAA
jgi:hypothetical protein